MQRQLQGYSERTCVLEHALVARREAWLGAFHLEQGTVSWTVSAVPQLAVLRGSRTARSRRK